LLDVDSPILTYLAIDSCGPTVYDFAHIGNFRAFILYDVIKRWLSFCGYSVEHICNLTDIDDKIVNKMLLENKSLNEITEKYIQAFSEDLQVRNQSFFLLLSHIPWNLEFKYYPCFSISESYRFY
jgi:cysteinyl-tRNA synthetase